MLACEHGELAYGKLAYGELAHMAIDYGKSVYGKLAYGKTTSYRYLCIKNHSIITLSYDSWGST